MFKLKLTLYRCVVKCLQNEFICGTFFQAELVRSDELLDDSLTMKEVSQIYGLYSKVKIASDRFCI